MANQNYILSTADFSARHDGDRNSLIIVNTSDQIYNSVSASGFSPMSEKSFSVKGTLSFTAIHKEVSPTADYSATIQAHSRMLASENPGGGRPGIPTDPNGGETPPPSGELLPVGDMLIPMIVIALVYIVVKLFNTCKTSQVL